MSLSAPRILCVAGDPGGANALKPVLALLANRFQLQFAAYRQALEIWQQAGWKVADLGASPTLDEAGLVLREKAPALLLTATSVNGIDWERYLLQAARELSIPSVSLLDFWSNYSRRFSLQVNLDSLPQQICVMDQRACNEMIAEGFPAEVLQITGQPALDACAVQMASAQLSAARALWPAGSRRILFVSQPLSALHGGAEGCRAALGFDEQSVLALVFDVLTQLQQQGQTIAARVLPHPRESAQDFLAAGYPLAHGFDAKVLVQAADIVIGMNSMLLLEAAAAGCVVISVQPDLHTADSLATNQSGATLPVYRAAQLLPVLTSLLDDPARYALQQALARQSAGDGQAAARVALCVERLIARQANPIS